MSRVYQDRGFQVIAQRWRGCGCELDLVFEGDDGLVFVEVKTARTHEMAAQRISRTQIDRILTAAAIFADQHANGAVVDMRFDVALVDGSGEVHILENALMAT